MFKRGQIVRLKDPWAFKREIGRFVAFRWAVVVSVAGTWARIEFSENGWRPPTIKGVARRTFVVQANDLKAAR